MRGTLVKHLFRLFLLIIGGFAVVTVVVMLFERYADQSREARQHRPPPLSRDL